jgi:hypothetical protein
LGGVFSRAEGFTSLNRLWGPIIFDMLSMGLGMFCIGKAAGAWRAA